MYIYVGNMSGEKSVYYERLEVKIITLILVARWLLKGLTCFLRTSQLFLLY